MTDNILRVERKRIELEKFRDLVLAAIEYQLQDTSARIKTGDFDSDVHFESLKKQTLEHYDNGRLIKLKHWFRDLTETHIEARNLSFNKYLQTETRYDIDIFEDYFKRVERIVQAGKITTDNQYYDISTLVDHLCNQHTSDNERICTLNDLLRTYEARKSKKRG